MAEFAETLRDLREARGMSRERLADAVGRSADAVSTWELGRNKPRRSTLVRIANALRVDVSELES